MLCSLKALLQGDLAGWGGLTVEYCRCSSERACNQGR